MQVDSLYLICDDELYEASADECEEDESGEGFWFAFEDEDEESFYEYCEVDPDDYE